jgi:hypothetical protein
VREAAGTVREGNVKQGNRPHGRGHILIGALVALAAIAASQRPLALAGDDLLVVSAATLLSLAAGLGVRRALLRTRGSVLPPAPRFAPLAGAEDVPRIQPRHLDGDGYERHDDEHERDNPAPKPTSAARVAVPERPHGARSARHTAPRRLAGASKG